MAGETPPQWTEIFARAALVVAQQERIAALEAQLTAAAALQSGGDFGEYWF